MIIDVIDKRRTPISFGMTFRWLPKVEEYFRCRRVDWLYWIIDIEPKWLFDILLPVVLLLILGTVVTL